MKLAYPLRDLQQEPPVIRGDCGCELYHGEFLAEWEGRMFCPDCWRGAVEQLLQTDPQRLAEELGLEVRRYP